MTAILAPPLEFQGMGFGGVPLPGGKLYSYIAGTSTPQATYVDSTQTTPNANPVLLDASGRANVWLNPALVYKFVLQDFFGNQIYVVDQVQGSLTAAALTTILTQSYLGAILYPPTAAEIAVASALSIPVNTLASQQQFLPYTAQRYGVFFDGATDTTVQFNYACAACIQAGATLQLADGTCIIGRLSVWTGALKLKGNGGEKSIIKVNSSAWPYTSLTTPIISSAFDFQAEDVGFDQSWVIATHGYPSGYGDGIAPSTWGGNWFGEFTGTGVFNVHHCKFYNTSRAFRVQSATDVNFCDNTSVGNAVPNHPPLQAICATQSCVNVRKSFNFCTATRWNAGGAFTYGLSALYGYSDSNVELSHNILVGHQMVYTGVTIGNSQRLVCIGNIIDTPIADTSFQNWQYISVIGNQIISSGDCGITVDNSQFVTISNNVINGTHVGGIVVGGCIYVTVTGNVIKDIAQDYPLICTNLSRYASTGGAWLAGISANFQAPDTGGLNQCITGNTMSFVNLPPVNDPSGPVGVVRANTIGIYFQETPTPSWITGSVTGNYIAGSFANTPLFYNRVPSHKFTINTKTGTPIIPEVFSNGANSFIYHGDTGAGGICYLKKLTGTIPNATAFTGASSGAVITSAASAALTWFQVVDTGNYDFTTIYNPY
jgi:parallel beta-helix repeat protein